MAIDPNTKRSDLDVLATTQLASWRGISFECGPISWAFDQQHAVHTYPDRDAGFIESTGRNPATFTFTALFRRGIVGEGGGRDAFPNNLFRFQSACADRSAGPLVHPILGTLTVKCQRIDVQVDPARRDGVDVNVTFIEATDREDELAALLAQVSPLGSCYDAARSFDSATVGPVPPDLPVSLRPSLLDSIKQLNGLLLQVQFGVGNILNKIDGMASAVNDLADTISSLNEPRNVTALNALERLFASLVRLSEEVRRQTRPIRPVTLPRDMTAPDISALFSTPLGDLFRLNPLLAGADVVSTGTQIFVLA
jgi:prophage DNA circulation protein